MKNKKEIPVTDILLHTPYEVPDPYGALNFPVYENAAYEFATAEQMADAFTGKTAQYTYSRIANPTVKYFEDRIRNITQAFSVTALNSGMAAVTNAIFTLARSGSNVVLSSHLFGNTYSFFYSTLKDFGVEARFCDFSDLDRLEQSIDVQTCAVFCELISNPQMEVVDLEEISRITHRKGVPFVVDTTIIPFSAFNAGKWGVDIEIVSSTKYISGGATSLGGLIVDYGSFDWNQSPKLKEYGGKEAFTTKLRKEIHRNLGAYMSPYTAHQQTLGLETLAIRYEKSARTCRQLVEELEKLPRIKKVNYPSLPSASYNRLSEKQFGELAGAMFTFDLESQEKCFHFLNRLQLIRRATNLFDNKTLAIHPASTIYGTFSEEQRRDMDVYATTIRISVGLEDMNTLLQDIKQALS